MTRSRIPILLSGLALWGGLGLPGYSQSPPNNSSQTPRQSGKKEADIPAPLPRGKKLVLKDGNFHIVRSYERNGERVRYYSLERGDWEEIPAALVDWEATARAAAEAEQASTAMVQKVHTQEQATKIETAMDIDASLQVGQGIFLPPGEGMFVIEGKSVRQLEQAGAQVKTDKKRFFEQVISTVPVIPSKHNVEIPGAKAKLRVTSANPEFYLREAPPDPERTSPVQKSSRPGESGPEVELVRAKVSGNKRRLESIRSMFGRELSTERNSISLERWEVAPTVFRFTLSESLPPGEYALAEILPDGMNLYVWDFGVDGTPGPKKTKEK
jgi:hypothetical protein